jgi:hypothetical protein
MGEKQLGKAQPFRTDGGRAAPPAREGILNPRTYESDGRHV